MPKVTIRSSPPHSLSRPTPDGHFRVGMNRHGKRYSKRHSLSHEHLTAISNTAIVRETILSGTGTKEVVFADTIKMSTYLVAFIVGEFEGTDPVYVGQTPLRVWAVPGKRHLARFGQEVGAASLRFFSDYYQYPYPGDKLDLIAIPDFAFGAMENLGAITYRETALLVDTKLCCATRTRKRLRMSSPMKTRTCGSATSSPCGGGMDCG